MVYENLRWLSITLTFFNIIHKHGNKTDDFVLVHVLCSQGQPSYIYFASLRLVLDAVYLYA